MQRQKLSTGFTVVLAMFAAMLVATTLMTATRAAAQTERVLYNFNFDNNGAGGTDPISNLIFDASGNLYGLTATGGASGNGTVFELTPPAKRLPRLLTPPAHVPPPSRTGSSATPYSDHWAR